MAKPNQKPHINVSYLWQGHWEQGLKEETGYPFKSGSIKTFCRSHGQTKPKTSHQCLLLVAGTLEAGTERRDYKTIPAIRKQ